MCVQGDAQLTLNGYDANMVFNIGVRLRSRLRFPLEVSAGRVRVRLVALLSGLALINNLIIFPQK